MSASSTKPDRCSNAPKRIRMLAQQLASSIFASAVMLALLMLLNISTSSHANIPSPSLSSFTRPLTAIAADAATGQGTAISRVDFYVDDARVGTAVNAPYTFDWPATSGPHALVAKAYDSISGITTSSVINITVTIPATAAPTIAIAAPLNSTTIALPALVPVTFNVSVAVGKTISKIELYNQTNLLWGGSTTTFNWQPLTAGSYSLIAKVTDDDGNVGLSAPINVSLTGAASEIITWLHNDLGGNTIMASDSLGGTLWKENFTPFGDRVIKDATATSNNRQWFAGKPQDAETGLSYFGARYYDPAVGRFMGIDAARFSEGNLHSFNRYAYGNNNPLRFIDPTGNSALSIFDWKDFAVDVGGLYVNHIVFAVAKINGNEAVAEFASQALAAGVVEAAISTVGMINPAPGSGSLLRTAVKSEVKAVETAVVKVEASAAKAGALSKPPTGPGSVPKSERDPQRFFTPAEREAKRAEQGHVCGNSCGTKIDGTNSAGHHIERHADGGRTAKENHAEVCVNCHKDIHSGGAP